MYGPVFIENREDIMSETLHAAQRELLTLYTQKAYEVYLAGNLKKTQEYIAKMQELNPGDANAVFLDGAVRGRGARPGRTMDCIRAAFTRWMPLLTQLKGEQLQMMQAAIDEAFSVMSYTPVEIASRQWDVYQNAQMAEELADVLEYLLALDDEYRKRASGQEQSVHADENGDRKQSAHADTGNDDRDPSRCLKEKEACGWIHSLFVRNYVFWIDGVLGVNKPIPVTENQAILTQYHRVLKATVAMAERMNGEGKSEQVVGERARKTMERFLHLNPAVQK
jgi:hypothetical protein